MILEFQNSEQIKSPSSDEIQQAVENLDGFRNSYFKVLKTNRNESLVISKDRNSKFRASIQSLSESVENEKTSKSPLSKNKVLKLVLAWTNGESLTPLMIRWDKSVQMNKKASQKKLNEFREGWEKEPLKMTLKTIYQFIGIFLVMLVLLMLSDYYLNRGFVSMFTYNPSISDYWIWNSVTAFVINLLIFIGTWPVKEDYNQPSA